MMDGERSWDTDVDVMTPPRPGARWAVEVKNLTAPTVAQLERILAHNQVKADELGLRNALVVKRKAGPGRRTPFLLVVELSLPDNLHDAKEEMH